MHPELRAILGNNNTNKKRVMIFQILWHIKLTHPSAPEFPLPGINSPMFGTFLSFVPQLKYFLFREAFLEHPISSLVFYYFFTPFYFLHSYYHYLIFSFYSLFIYCLFPLECMQPVSPGHMDLFESVNTRTKNRA